ncbi:MAG: hypothetical protein Q9210_006954 [Variospora velana]
MNLNDPVQDHDVIPLDKRRVPDNFSLPFLAGDDAFPVGKFCPPEISEILYDGEHLQPDQAQLRTAITDARVYWCRLAEKALSQHRRGLLPQQVNPFHMLGRVPAIPDKPGRICTLAFDESFTDSALFLEAHSTFQVGKNEGCTASGNVKNIPALLLLGVKSSTLVNWNGTSFHQWVGIEGENRTKNYISILALAWSYILSVRLLEMQGQGDTEIAYTESTAIGYKHETGDRIAATITIDIGDVDENATRWWAAILAPGQGWKAMVSRSDDVVYLSPWSVRVEDERRFGIGWRATLSSSQNSILSTPPSSTQAFELLVKFCSLHNLGSQCLAALATALTFPTHNHYGTAATLPFPNNVGRRGESAPGKPIAINLAKLSKELPYYMTLSCNHSVMVSSLCGVFWEPKIPCNLVSPWLHPVMNEVPMMEEVINFKGRYHEVLAIMCAIRRPKLSALWLGAVISGLVPRILDFVRSGAPPLDLNAFSWTGCPQSFMDLAGSGPYCRTGEKIQRADAWRLLYLPTVIDDDLCYKNYPFTPWKPVGTTSVENSVARIRIHRCCDRHHVDYQHWTWQLEDGSTLVDQGLGIVPALPISQEGSPRIGIRETIRLPAVDFSLDQEASRAASWEIFRWVTANGEGVPADEPIYKDAWLHDETVSEAPSSPKDDPTDSIDGWPGSSTSSHVASNGGEAVSPKTTLDRASPQRNINIDSWFNGLSPG